jgi:hypothetical protein
MTRWTPGRGDETRDPGDGRGPRHRLLTDGGRESDEGDGENADDSGDENPGEPDGKKDTDSDEGTGVDRSNVEVTAAGETDPVDPKWEKPDIEDIPEVDGPKTRPAETSETREAAGGDRGGTSSDEDAVGPSSQGDAAHAGVGGEESADPTAGMPNTARSPGQSRLKEGGADGYVVALELCARLPDDVRLPEEAADLVPVALEAELEQDVQSFAAEEFDNPAPHVETLDFVEVDDELWFRLRLGVDPESFADLDPEEIQDHALQKIDGLL